MNKKMIVISTLAAIIAVSGGLALNSSNKLLAATAPVNEAVETTANKAVEGDIGERVDMEGKEGKRGKDGKDGKSGKEGKKGTDGSCPPGAPLDKSNPKGETGSTAGPKIPSASIPTITPTPTQTPTLTPTTSTLAPSTTSEQSTYSVVITNGMNTDPQDHGRPVVLIASALGVTTEVFREAFSGVTPSGLDSEPSSELAQRNKAALLKVLAPLGITNERLDEVSNYYRYNGSKGETWKSTAATAIVTVKNGAVTGVTITNPGSGYSSIPTITIKGPNGTTMTAKATIAFTKDFKTNGSLSAITLES